MLIYITYILGLAYGKRRRPQNVNSKENAKNKVLYSTKIITSEATTQLTPTEYPDRVKQSVISNYFKVTNEPFRIMERLRNFTEKTPLSQVHHAVTTTSLPIINNKGIFSQIERTSTASITQSNILSQNSFYDSGNRNKERGPSTRPMIFTNSTSDKRYITPPTKSRTTSFDFINSLDELDINEKLPTESSIGSKTNLVNENSDYKEMTTACTGSISECIFEKRKSEILKNRPTKISPYTVLYPQNLVTFVPKFQIIDQPHLNQFHKNFTDVDSYNNRNNFTNEQTNGRTTYQPNQSLFGNLFKINSESNKVSDPQQNRSLHQIMSSLLLDSTFIGKDEYNFDSTDDFTTEKMKYNVDEYDSWSTPESYSFDPIENIKNNNDDLFKRSPVLQPYDKSLSSKSSYFDDYQKTSRNYITTESPWIRTTKFSRKPLLHSGNKLLPEQGLTIQQQEIGNLDLTCF